MKLTHTYILVFCVLFLTSCDIKYFTDVSLGQIQLLSRRVPIEKALETYEFTENEIKKLKLVSKVKKFAKEQLELDINEKIYSTYVQLEQPYVSYLLRVAFAYELKAYEWDFPVIGLTPYKGFFSKEKALKAAKLFPPEEYDTYVRGVTAYSTLNWFEDSILSSMLAYSERNFVVTLFHELAHTVLFFKDHINFNERFAEFVGRRAAEQFYASIEGEGSQTLKQMQNEWADELQFSSFITNEYQMLKTWYEQNKGKISPEIKKNRLQEMQKRFLLEVKPNLHTQRYNYFSKLKLNNALLLSYRSYQHNTGEFETLFNSSKINKNISAFVKYCSQFEDAKNPEQALSQSLLNLK